MPQSLPGAEKRHLRSPFSVNDCSYSASLDISKMYWCQATWNQTAHLHTDISPTATLYVYKDLESIVSLEHAVAAESP